MSDWTPRRMTGAAGLLLAGGGVAGLALGGGVPALGLFGLGTIVSQLLLLDTRPVKTPVVMLHSVAGFREDRPGTFSVWCPPPHFESYLKYLRWRGYTTITLDHLYRHLREGASLPDKPIVLTFDDGYLDNWVYAAPLLEKYGFTGTVFVPTDFIQPGDQPRPTLKDVWVGRLSEKELEVYGYLNRAEIEALSSSGVLDIQSHGRTHTWVPISSEIIDFHRPGLSMRQLRWMWWNRYPERKPFWFHQIRHEDIPWGLPVYRSDLRLAAPEVPEDPELARRLVEYVRAEGGEAFFDRAEWKKELDSLVEAYGSEDPTPPGAPGDAAFRTQLVDELRGSREILEGLTAKPVRFMCWPNGGTCPEAFGLLEECGYLAATLPSRMKQPRNFRGTNPSRIGRVSATSFFRESRRILPWTLSFGMKIERNRGNLYMELPIKAIWFYRRFIRPAKKAPPGSEG